MLTSIKYEFHILFLKKSDIENVVEFSTQHTIFSC